MSVPKDPYRELFVQEARELLDTVEDAMAFLGPDGTMTDRVQSQAMFRAAHSLKGMSATLGYDAAARLAHVMEDRLERLQQGGRLDVDDLSEAVEALRTSVEAIALGREVPDLEPLVARLREAEAMSSAQQIQGPRAPGAAVAKEAPRRKDAPARPAVSDVASPARHVPASVRVDAARLDAILDRTAALRTAQGRLERLLQEALPERPGYSLSEAVGALHRQTHDLYAQALSLRTLPASLVTRPLLRRVRQTANRHGKQVDLVVEGEEVHLDRSLLEALGDPLMHLVTNAVVHGIESPQARAVAGKPERGAVRLFLQREDGTLFVRVADDGAGIDLEAVRERAVEMGLCSSEDAARVPEPELVQWVLRPGFTTSASVSEEAGRGVGLDAVAESVHRVAGRIRIDTTLGAGTTVALELPAELSLLEVLPVRVAQETYVVPAQQVERVVGVGAQDLATGSMVVDGGAAKRRVPVRALDSLLGLTAIGSPYVVDEGDQARIVQQARRIRSAVDRDGPGARPAEGPAERHEVAASSLPAGHPSTAGLLVETRDGHVVLAVQNVQAPEEIVVKPLHLPTGPLRGTSGAAVMGDGGVAVVLDLARLPILDEAPPMARS